MSWLVDTHYLLWAAYQSSRIKGRAKAVMEDGDTALWFSSASLWEVAIKRALDRPDFRIEPGQLRAGLLSNGYREMPIEGRHVLAVRALPHHHSDPFDRMLIAQAASEGMALLTADRKLCAYGSPVEFLP